MLPSKALWMLLVLLVWLISCGSAEEEKRPGGDRAADEVRELYPDQERIAERLRSAGYAYPASSRFSVLPTKVVYELKGLQPNQHYEVRISYPGSIPSKFVIAWASPSSSEDEEPASRLLTGRDLLDTEKIMFVTDERGGILSGVRTSIIASSYPKIGTLYCNDVCLRRETHCDDRSRPTRKVNRHLRLESK